MASTAAVTSTGLTKIEHVPVIGPLDKTVGSVFANSRPLSAVAGLGTLAGSLGGAYWLWFRTSDTYAKEYEEKKKAVDALKNELKIKDGEIAELKKTYEGCVEKPSDDKKNETVVVGQKEVEKDGAKVKEDVTQTKGARHDEYLAKEAKLIESKEALEKKIKEAEKPMDTANRKKIAAKVGAGALAILGLALTGYIGFCTTRTNLRRTIAPISAK